VSSGRGAARSDLVQDEQGRLEFQVCECRNRAGSDGREWQVAKGQDSGTDRYTSERGCVCVIARCCWARCRTPRVEQRVYGEFEANSTSDTAALCMSQTNADTPLSRVFDHKSSLEQLHCALLLRLMHKYGMGHLLMTRPSLPVKTTSGGKAGLVSYASSPSLNATYQQQKSSAESGLRQPHGFRWLLVQTVLATDMSVHFDWIKRFKEYATSDSSGGLRKVPEDEERLMICQALIKCGDISNPVSLHSLDFILFYSYGGGRLDLMEYPNTGLASCSKSGRVRRRLSKS
jgi:hypothetical protein